jgi:hypothetical protein
MIAPLEHAQQSEGGKNRVKNQSKADQKFLAMLAASRRPLMHDVPVTPQGLLNDLKELAAMRKWIYLGIVGVNSKTIRHDQNEETIVRKLKEVGGALGLIGITTFASGPPEKRSFSFQVFYRPLKKGTSVIEKLDKAKRELLAVVLESLEDQAAS